MQAFQNLLLQQLLLRRNAALLHSQVAELEQRCGVERMCAARESVVNIHGCCCVAASSAVVSTRSTRGTAMRCVLSTENTVKLAFR
jgi:hypothetical protein